MTKYGSLITVVDGSESHMWHIGDGSGERARR
jgi:hypothetical protein